VNHPPRVVRSSRASRVSRLLARAVSCAVVSASLVSTAAARQAPPPPTDAVRQTTSPPEAERDGDPGRGRWSGMEGRPRGRGRGPGSEADFDRMIAVIEDISPEWASSLRTRLTDDPDAAREDFRRHGRRLFGLVMLKERNPRLYAVRVAELALKKGMKETAIEYHRVLATDPTLAESIAGRLREMAAESVDLELRARAMELEALDQAVRELREKLLGEVEERSVRIESVWKSLIETDPSASGADNGDPFGELPGEPRDGAGAESLPERPGIDRS
jgi:hypothetical protein